MTEAEEKEFVEDVRKLIDKNYELSVALSII